MKKLKSIIIPCILVVLISSSGFLFGNTDEGENIAVGQLYTFTIELNEDDTKIISISCEGEAKDCTKVKNK